MERFDKAYKGVVDYFRKKILAGELKPGEKLPPEREIAESLSVSRNSVREAIKILDMTGVISSRHGSGNYIDCNFDQSISQTMSMMFALHQVNYEQISQVRNTLERQALLLAIDHATDEQVENLESLVYQFDHESNERYRAVLDKQIHYKIAEYSGNTLLLDILEACSEVIELFIKDVRERIMRDARDAELLNSTHRQLVQSIRDRNPEQGLSALRHHFYLVDLILEKEKIVVTGDDALL